jgi:hypothetical protein
MKNYSPQLNRGTSKIYLWEPILKQAWLMEQEDLTKIIQQIPQQSPLIKHMLNEILFKRFH